MPFPPPSSSSVPAPGRQDQNVTDGTAAPMLINSGSGGAAHQTAAAAAAAAALPSPVALAAIAGYGYGFGGYDPPMAARAAPGGVEPGTLEALVRFAGWNNNNHLPPPWAPPPFGQPSLVLSPSAMASAVGRWTQPPSYFSSGLPPPPSFSSPSGPPLPPGTTSGSSSGFGGGGGRYEYEYDLGPPGSRGKPPSLSPLLGQSHQITAAAGASAATLTAATGSSSTTTTLTTTCETKSPSPAPAPLPLAQLSVAGGGGGGVEEEGEGEERLRLGPAVLAMPTTTLQGKVAVTAASGGGHVRKRRSARNDDVIIGSSNSKPASPAPSTSRKPSSRLSRASSTATSNKQETDKDHANHAVVVVVENQNQNQPAAAPAKSGRSTAMAGARVVIPAPSPPAGGGGRKRRQSASAAAAPPPARSSPAAARRIGAKNAPAPAPTPAPAPAPPPAVRTTKKHTILTWLIDRGFLSEGETVVYVPGGVPTTTTAAAAVSVSGEPSTEKAAVTGTVTRSGMHCSCCNTMVSLPAFEAHAGRPAAAAAAAAGPKSGSHHHRRLVAWEELLLVSSSGGNSLLWCLQEAWEAEKVRTFQAQAKTRLALEKLEEKNSMVKKRLLARYQRSAVVVDRIMSPRMEKIKAAGAEKDSNDDACGVCADGGELLCCDTCTSTFHEDCVRVEVPEGMWSCHYCRCKVCMSNAYPDLCTCQQCTLKYHEGCRPLPDNGRDISAYCSDTCKKLSTQLSDVTGVTNLTEDGFSWTLLRIQKDEPASSEEMPAVLERNVKLAVALGVLNECFNPVMDRRTKIDMLRQAVYSLESEYKRLSYEGFYTMVLEKDEEIVSVALLRIHGTKVAEMPFAGTLPAYRKQGMMRRLVNVVEQVLASVQVEKLMIPAIASMVDTWKKSFSFTPVEPQLREELKALSLVVITGTTLLYKPVVGSPPPPPLPQQQDKDKGKGKAVVGSGSDPEAWWRKYADPSSRLTDDERAFLEMDPDTAPPPFRYADLVTGEVSLNGLSRTGNASSSACTSAAVPVSPGRGRGRGRGRTGGWRCRGEAASAMVPLPLPQRSYGRGGSSRGILHGMK